ncbi:MAG: hypothetical protein II857_06340 [Selenomonadaceae bacterium]|nr:hypothetical protein [Selenomonadaceae bacterium]
MSTPVGVIKKFVKTLVETKKTGEEAADEAFKAVGAISYDVFREKYTNASYGVASQNFAEQNCGVRITNTDTGAITGSDAGGKTTKTAESIVPESAKATKLTNSQYNSFTKNGLKFNISYVEKSDVDAGENFGYSGANFLAKQKLVTRALYNWWIPESVDLINESLGINFTDDSSNLKEVDIEFDYWNPMNIHTAMSIYFEYDLGRLSKAKIILNANLLNNLTENDKNGTLDSKQYYNRTAYPYVTTGYGNTAPFTNYLDRLFLMAFTEIALKSNIAYLEDLPKDVFEGLCAIVGGYDDASQNYGDFVNRDNNNSVTGYTRLRYLAKNYSDGVPDGVSYNAKKTVLTVTADYTEDTLDLADFESTVKHVKASALKKNIKITGNALENSIISGAGNDYLLGGKGNDTLNGGKGNDTLKGGAGNDIFIYTAGKDVISDYSAGDKISVGSAISKATLSGSDVVFTIGKGTLTVKNGADKKLSMINSKGKEYTTVVSGATTLTINNKTTSPVTLSADIGTADASKRTSAVKIVGNKLDNVILGGSKNDIIYGEGGNDSIIGNKGNDKLYGGLGSDTLKGGAGNDTLIGGAGNDSLWGDAGADVFIYSAGTGKDIIFGFDAKDTLTLDSLDFTATYKNSAVTFKFEDGTLTLKDFTAKTFNINDDTYKISGSKLVKQ